MANVLTMGDSAFNYVSKDETGEVTFTVIRNGEIVKVKVPKGNYMTYQTNLSENVLHAPKRVWSLCSGRAICCTKSEGSWGIAIRRIW